MSGSRYSELVAVDVSEESFQRLTTRPRKSHASSAGSRGGRGGRGRKGRSAEPNIMDLYPLECVQSLILCIIMSKKAIFMVQGLKIDRYIHAMQIAVGYSPIRFVNTKVKRPAFVPKIILLKYPVT